MTNTFCHKPVGNREVDLSDVWVEECDPENEQGLLCTGIFDVQDGGNVHLVGLRLEGDGDTPAYCDREWAINCLGVEAVLRVERVVEAKVSDAA